MERADLVEMRKALEMVKEMKKAGVLFVPVPVNSPKAGKILWALALAQMEQIAGLEPVEE